MRLSACSISRAFTVARSESMECMDLSLSLDGVHRRLSSSGCRLLMTAGEQWTIVWHHAREPQDAQGLISGYLRAAPPREVHTFGPSARISIGDAAHDVDCPAHQRHGGFEGAKRGVR